ESQGVARPRDRRRLSGGRPEGVLAVAEGRAKFRRTLRVVYPLRDSRARIGLRTELDWSRDVFPDGPEDGGHTFTFTLESEKPFLYVKPVLRTGDDLRFAPGTNKLILMTEPDE